MTEALILLALILFGGFLAMAEMAVGASRVSRLKKLAENGAAGALAALRLRDKPSKLLSATQLGITVAALLSGIFGEASWVETLKAQIESGIPAAAAFSYPLALTAVVTAITFVSLVLGEVVPRRIALSHPEACAVNVAPLIETFLSITTPVIWLVSKTADRIISLLPGPSTKEISAQEEIRMLISEGRRGGDLRKSEGEMLENVFRLDERRVAAIMTPASAIVFIDIKESKEETSKAIMEKKVARFIVCKGGLSDIIGWISASDALRSIAENGHFDIGSIQIRQMQFVSSNLTIIGLLEMFRKNRTSAAIAVNEFGTVEGLVTGSDLLGTMMGEAGLSGSGEGGSPLAIRRDDGSWLLDGLLPIDEMVDILEMDDLPEEITGSFHTVGGFMVSIMGRIPKKAESTEIFGWKFEIVDMDKTRVDEVIAKKIA